MLGRFDEKSSPSVLVRYASPTYRSDSRRLSVRCVESVVSLARRIASIACRSESAWQTIEPTDLVQKHVVGAAERAAALLKNVADGVDLHGASAQLGRCRRTYAELQTNLLVDDDAHEPPGRVAPLLARQELLVRQTEERGL